MVAHLRFSSHTPKVAPMGSLIIGQARSGTKMTDTFQQVSGNLEYDGNRLFLFFSPTIVVDQTNLAAVMSA